ncbi:MAG: PIG-L deacetylase family protein [Gammaproteobacteria bacterium]
MLNEAELVPYACSPLPNGPWVVFAPHPDDETFGMGGSLLLAAQQGIDTHVVFMTDGAEGGDGNKQALIEKRMEEGRRAADGLGVTTVTFLAEPDRGLQFNDRVLQRVIAELDRVHPASVFFPSVLEFHPDHRVTAQLVWKALQQRPALNAHAYSYEISTHAPANVMIDVTEVAEAKYEIIKIYASQLTQSKYLALVKALDTGRTFSLAMDRTAAEAFFYHEDHSLSLESQLASKIETYFIGLGQG